MDVGEHGLAIKRIRTESKRIYFLQFGAGSDVHSNLFFYFFEISSQDLQTITTVQQNGAIANGGKKHELYNHSSPPNAMEVESLCKTYDGRNLALKNVTFDVKSGEVRLTFSNDEKMEKLEFLIVLFCICFSASDCSERMVLANRPFSVYFRRS